MSAQWSKGPGRIGAQGNTFLRSLLGTINVIFTTLGRTNSHPSRVMSVARLLAEDSKPEPKKARGENQPTMSFFKEDKARTIQPYDVALVVTLRIGGYNIKRVMMDQGSGAKIMYLNLYNGLGLKLEDLTTYD